jgi:hypothetical protein
MGGYHMLPSEQGQAMFEDAPPTLYPVSTQDAEGALEPGEPIQDDEEEDLENLEEYEEYR